MGMPGHRRHAPGQDGRGLVLAHELDSDRGEPPLPQGQPPRMPRMSSAGGPQRGKPPDGNDGGRLRTPIAKLRLLAAQHDFVGSCRRVLQCLGLPQRPMLAVCPVPARYGQLNGDQCMGVPRHPISSHILATMKRPHDGGQLRAGVRGKPATPHASDRFLVEDGGVPIIAQRALRRSTQDQGRPDWRTTRRAPPKAARADCAVGREPSFGPPLGVTRNVMR